MTISNNVFISGSVAFSKGATTMATLSDGTQKEVATTFIGADSVNVFLGTDGPATRTGATGLSITGAGFGLALLTPTDALDKSRYYGVEAHAASASIVGISDFTLTATSISVLANGGTDTTVSGRVVDFRKGDLDGDANTTDLTRIDTGSKS